MADPGDEAGAAAFYDALASVYHLVYADWEGSVERQGRALDAVLRAAGAPPGGSVLDAACGIGTQSLGLARLGWRVTASDLSPAAVARAAREAEARGLALETGVADMRRAFDHHRRTFDAVIACDNAVPHLLSDGAILAAFEQLLRCTTPGGLCLVSARDYEATDTASVRFVPHGVHREGGTRHVVFQLWEPRPPLYDTTLYVIRHEEGAEPVTLAARSTYYAVPLRTLATLLERAGFEAVERLDEPFFQPVLLGRRPAAS